VTRIVAASVAALAVVVLALSAPARATSIADIVADGEAFNGQQVTVVGTTAAPRANYGGETMYTLAADGRRITVFGRGSAPAVGERVEVDAKVGWREGDEEFTWPPVLFQSARRPAP